MIINMLNLYLNKYIKYKDKYLLLLEKLNNNQYHIQVGGTQTIYKIKRNNKCKRNSKHNSKCKRNSKCICKRKIKRSAPKIFGSMKNKGLKPHEDIPNATRLDKEGMVYAIDKDNGIYFCDKYRKYQFKCNGFGLELLKKLIIILYQMIKQNDNLISNKSLEEQKEIRRQGFELYEEKPTLRKKREKGEQPGTWSNDEYGFSGLQWMYIRFKSYQRFTETWALLERCKYNNLIDFTNNNLRIVSLGGGPGFELLACDLFIQNLNQSSKSKSKSNIEFVSLDLQPSWNIYIDVLGIDYSFHQFDIHKPNISNIIGSNNKDVICILSNILCYCTDEQTAELFATLLNVHNVKCILVNERGASQYIIELLNKRNIKIVHLLDQVAAGRDDRQMVFFPSASGELGYKIPPKDIFTFPNQPYEENKYK